MAGLSGVARELRQGWQGLRRERGLAITATATLAAGLTAATLMFAVVSTVLWRPLPFKHSSRLVMVWGHIPQLSLGFDAYPIHGRFVADIRANVKALATTDGFKADLFNLAAADGQVQRVDGIRTTAGFFATMGVEPAAGRFFAAGEDTPGRDRVAVIGFGLWMRMFGGSRALIGQTVRINDEPYEVIGVAPRGFDFPRGGEMPANFQFPARAELWVPAALPTRGPSDLAIVARLADGVSLAQAQSALDRHVAPRSLVPERERIGWACAPCRSISRDAAGDADDGAAPLRCRGRAGAGRLWQRGAAPRRARPAPPRRLRRPVGAGCLAGAAGARRRRRVRARLDRGVHGRGRGRGVRRRPGSRGGALAVPAALRAGARLAAGTLRRRVRRGDRGRHLGVAGARATRPQAATVLRSAGRGTVGGARRIRQVVLTAQVAVSVVLLIASALLLRSLVERLRADTGFQPERVITFELTLPPVSYPEQLRGATPAIRPRIVAAVDAVLARLRAIPGVGVGGGGQALPMSGAQEATGYTVEGWRRRAPDQLRVAEYIVASGDLFRTLGARILSGRELSEADREDSLPVIVVNRAFAEATWPGQDRRAPAPARIAGRAGSLDERGRRGQNTKRYALDEKPLPAIIVPYTQGPYPTLSTMPFAVRSKTGDPALLVPAIRAAVAEVDPLVPVASVAAMTTLVARVSEDARFVMVLMGLFAATALLLTTGGLFGAVAYAVAERRPEIGLRLALGAAPSPGSRR